MGEGKGQGYGGGKARGKTMRVAVPAMPMPLAVLCCVLNFLVPGLGMISELFIIDIDVHVSLLFFHYLIGHLFSK